MESNKRRSKNGCLTCRRKKKKCDENQPICGLCLKTNTECEWPVSKKAMFLPQNNMIVQDFNKNKNKKSNPNEFNKRSSAELEVENEYSDKINKNQRAKPDIENSHKKYHASHDTVEQNMNIIAHDLNPIPVPTPELSRPIFDMSECISSKSSVVTANSVSSTVTEYQDLYGTLRDFMFLNAATRDTQSPINIPSDLNNVDVDNYFNDFLKNNYNNNNQRKGNLGALPHVVSGTSLSNVVSNTTKKNCKYILQADESFMSHLSISESISINQNVIDEIKLDTNYFELFTNFVEEVAGWLDMFDRKKHFTTVISNLSRESIPLYYSILALSSRQLDKTGKSENKERTYALYERSLYYLVPLVNDNSSIEVVASCIILCVFEMMDSSPINWKKHLKGCATLLTASNIHGQGSPLERSLFWCFSRMDICNAVINSEPTLVPLRKWGDQTLIDEGRMNNMDIAAAYKKKFMTLTSYDFDMYSNYIVFLAARTVNLIEGGENFIATDMSSDSFEKDYIALYHELLEWYINRPSTMKPIACHTENEEFPKLFFSNSPGTSSNQMYHMLMILMNTNRPRSGKKCKLDGVKHPYRNHLNNVWHAKRIIGISLSNIRDHACLTNALQPIYIAGKILTSHKEHETILSLLKKIEKTTGWVCSWRRDDLIELWNDYI